MSVLGDAGAIERKLPDGVGNLILNRLPPNTRERVMAQTIPGTLRISEVLFEPGEVIAHVYLPLSCVVSLVSPFEDGTLVEVATIGNEGIVGVPLFADGSLAVRATTSVAGRALRMEAGAFLTEYRGDGALHDLVQDYTLALFGQISQAVACNRLHSIEQRLSRWLLMSRDRMGADEFAITIDFLAEILGCGRSAITLSARTLQIAGLIRYGRGRVEIRDCAGLQETSCECYGVIRGLLEPS